jgi:cytochrome c
VTNIACMRDCKVEIGLASSLPDFARGTHGNLAEQQRLVGPARGTDTEKPIVSASPVSPPVARPKVATLELAKKSNCMTCHQVDKKIVGPSFSDVAKKYKDDAAAEGRLVEKVKRGGSGAWGSIPMPPNALKDEDLRTLVKWVLAGSPGK